MKRNIVFFGIAVIGLSLFLSLCNFSFGNLNQDEGWYLYAARSVAAGKTPYVDFAYTQAPVLPYVYAIFQPIISKFGVAGGRGITFFFGFFSILFAAATAWRLSTKNRAFAVLATVLLIGGNVYQSYFTTIIKTYALCSFFLMAGFFVLTWKGKWGAFFGAVLLALAAGTRLSSGIVLLVIGIGLLIRSFRFDKKELDWFFFGLGGGLALGLIFIPFLLKAPEQTIFGLVGYHAERETAGLAQACMLKVGFISRFVQAYLLFVLGLLGVLCLVPFRNLKSMGMVGLLGLSGLVLTLVHFLAPFPYDDYQTIAFPLLATSLALLFARVVPTERTNFLLLFLLLASLATAFSSPINQQWFVRGRDRIWWKFKLKSDLALLKDAAQTIRENTKSDQFLFTQDTYLAIEANRNVPVGMEMGPFCYYPNMSRARAEKLHLLNREMMDELLQKTSAPTVALSGYGLAIESPSITCVSEAERTNWIKKIEQRYHLIKTIPYFGQAHTTLNIYTINGVRP